MAWIRQVSPEEANGPIRRVYAAAVARAGGVANIIRVMSADPASADASMLLYSRLLKAPNALDPARREMLATVVSNANDCFY
ncbi:MAG: hypothetical protein H6811_02805 [Phycisphaeraceae bacterium]|nr:hypothetical protein [Phycisphaeraceae bacterium]